MTENEKRFIALLGSALCTGMDCEKCHDIFGMNQCPEDFVSSKKEVVNYAKDLLAKYQCTDTESWTDDDFMKLLLGD